MIDEESIHWLQRGKISGFSCLFLETWFWSWDLSSGPRKHQCVYEIINKNFKLTSSISNSSLHIAWLKQAWYKSFKHLYFFLNKFTILCAYPTLKRIIRMSYYLEIKKRPNCLSLRGLIYHFTSFSFYLCTEWSCTIYLCSSVSPQLA